MSTGIKLFQNSSLEKYLIILYRCIIGKTNNISFMYIYKFIQSANLWKFVLDWQRSYFLIRLHFMYTQHMFTNVNHQSCCNFISFNIRISFKVNSAMLFPIFRKGMTISFFVKRLVYISHHQGEDVILKGVTKVFDGYLLKCQIIFSCKVE